MEEKPTEENDYAAAWRTAREMVGPLSFDREVSSSYFSGIKEEEEVEVQNEEPIGFEAKKKDPIEKMEVEEGGEDIDTCVPSVPPITIPLGERFFDTLDRSSDRAVHMDVDVEEGPDVGDDDSCTFASDGSDDDLLVVSRGPKRGIDIQLLAKILEEAKRATAAIDKNSDVVLVLGGTGVGKSTFIQAVSGRKIVRGWDDGMNKSSFVVEQGQSELEGFEIGHGLQSCTRHVRSFFREASSTHYVDSSGFSDTDSIETDIATSISVREIAQRAGRLRFVVLINANQFYSDRATELKRNLDVVAKFIGHNFADHKKSFTFLFTHCNYVFEEARDLIKGLCDSAVVLSSIKQTLVKLLSGIKKATPDNETRELVTFLLKSLASQYPFCDVFDPVLSDIVTICREVEPATAKKSILDPAKHVTCSLTTLSAHLIANEVKNRRENIITRINGGLLDNQLCQDVLAIQTLSTHIDSIRSDWIDEVLSVLSAACGALEEKLYQVVSRGTSPESVDFDIDDALAVKKSIEQMSFLRKLSDGCKEGVPTAFPADVVQSEKYAHLVSILRHKMKWVEQEIGVLDHLLDKGENTGPCLEALSVIMDKLNFWAIAFPGDISKNFESTRMVLGDKLLAFMTNATKNSFPVCLKGGLKAIRCLVVLKRIRESGLLKFCFDEPQEPFDQAPFDQAFTWLVREAMELFRLFPPILRVSAVDTLESPPSGEIFIEELVYPVNLNLREAIADLESISELIKAEKLRRDLGGCDLAHLAMDSVIAEFDERYQVCLALISNASENNAHTIKVCLRSLHVFAHSVPNGIFSDKISFIDYKLQQRVSHLVETVVVRSSNLDSIGFIGTGLIHRSSIESIQSFAWIDSLGKPDADCVSINETIQKATELYLNFSAALAEKASAALAFAFDKSSALDSACQQLESVAESCAVLQEVCLISSMISDQVQILLSPLFNQIMSWIKNQPSSELPDSFLDLNVKEFVKRIAMAHGCKAICACKLPALLDLQDVLESYLSTTGDKCAGYRSEIESFTAPEPTQFKMIAKVLDQLSGLPPFPNQVHALPSAEHVRQSIQHHLHGVAEEIDSRIKSFSCGTDIDEIDKHFKYLEDGVNDMGTHVDSIKMILGPMRQSIAGLKAELDTSFRSFVEDDNFRSIVTYLNELKSSYQTQHYRLCLKLLSSRLRSRVDSIRLFLDNPLDCSAEKAKLHITILKEAVEHLGCSYDSLPAPSEDQTSWQLQSTLESLKEWIESTFTAWFHKTLEAVKDMDYINAVAGVKTSRILRGLIDGNESCERMAKMNSEINEMLSKPSKLIDEFLGALINPKDLTVGERNGTSSFPNTKQLRVCLSALSTAVQSSDCPASVIRLRSDSKKKLERGFDNILKTLEQEWTGGHFTLALEVLSFLRKEVLHGSLKDHVDLSFDVEKVLNHVSRLKTDQQHKFRSTPLDEEAINNIANQLDTLSKPKSGLFSYLFSKFSKWDYYEQCSAVAGKVKELCNDVVAKIRNQNFRCLRKSILLLRYASEKLQPHIRGRIDDTEEQVVLALRQVFAHIHRCMKKALEDNNIGHFSRALFKPYHEMVTDMCQQIDSSTPVPVGAVERTCLKFRNDVHQLLLQHCQVVLRDFNELVQNMKFAELELLAGNLLELGHFLITQFQWYYKECSRWTTNDSDLEALMDLIRINFASGKVSEIGLSFGILELHHSATIWDVKKAFKQMSQIHHPDKNKDSNGRSERFLEVKEAYDGLLDVRSLEMLQKHDFYFVTKAARMIPGIVAKLTNQYLADCDYKSTMFVLNKLDRIDSVLRFVKDPKIPNLVKVDTIRTNVMDQIKRHGNGLVVDVKRSHTCQDFLSLHHAYSNLERFENTFKSFDEIVGTSLTAVVLSELQENLESLSEKAFASLGNSENQANQGLAMFVKRIIPIGQFFDGFPRLKKQAWHIINILLDRIQDEPWGASFIFKFGLMLDSGELAKKDDGMKLAPNDEECRVGKVIVQSFPHFQDVRTVVFNREVITADLSDCLAKTKTRRCVNSGDLKEVSIDGDAIRSECDKYDTLFDRYFDEFVRDGHDNLVKRIFQIVHGIGECRVATWSASAKAEITEILAGVFATFTIIKSGTSFQRFTEHDTGNKNDSILFRPHKIQIIAILRLLGIGTEEQALPNHIMEIRTGEGKSIILGALSVVLALLGFSVRCVSYSEHLSARDEELFRKIFDAFGVSNRVIYSNIDSMSQDTITRKGDVQELTIDMVKQQNSFGSSRASSSAGTNISKSLQISRHESPNEINDALSLERRNRDLLIPQNSPLPLNGEEILLVDEVDVFFGPNFYGETLNFAARLRDPLVEALMMKVWDYRLAGVSFESVSRWVEYSSLLERYKRWERQIKSQVRQMVSDVLNFSSPPYEFDQVNMRIGYKHLDSVRWGWTYGYRTGFACLHEMEQRQLKGSGPSADEMLHQALSLLIYCGNFSYAHIEPTAILGVSGTLGALSTEERLIVKDFNIDTYSFVPSVYGGTNLSFDSAGRGIIIESEKSRHMQTIANEMKQAIDRGGSAIAFFEDDTRLAEFEKSKYWKEFRHANVLSSVTDKDTRKYVIDKAATSSQATISTAVFGRGTDFFCKDSKLESGGGMLVVQTFLSVEKSEEIQMKGRTARQGKKGSYCMVLLGSDLSTKFGIQSDEWASVARKDLYDFLDQRRTCFHSEELVRMKKKVKEAEEKDKLSRSYLDALVCGDHETAKTILDKFYD